MAKKRVNGEGTIGKRKDGRWEARYIAGRDPETGKQIRKSILGKTQAEVRAKLKDALAEAAEIDVVKSSGYSVSGWMQAWYSLYAQPNVRETTARYYKGYIDHHVLPRLGDIPLNKLTSLDIQQFYKDLLENGRIREDTKAKKPGLSSTTVHGIHVMLKSALKRAVQERLIPFNPAEFCIPPKITKPELQVIPSERYQSYLTAAEQRGVLPMFYLELATGLRKGEIAALLWSDYDAQTQTIHVTKQYLFYNGQGTVSPPKSSTSVRYVSIPEEAAKLLEQEHAKHPKNPYMFPSPVYGIWFLVIGPVVNVLFALLLFEIKNRTRLKFYQTVITFPNFMSMVIVGYVTYAILSPQTGIMNSMVNWPEIEKMDMYTYREAIPASGEDQGLVWHSLWTDRSDYVEEPCYLTRIYRDYLWFNDKKFLKDMQRPVQDALNRIYKQKVVDGLVESKLGNQSYDLWKMPGFGAYVNTPWLYALYSVIKMNAALGSNIHPGDRTAEDVLEQAKQSFIKYLWDEERGYFRCFYRTEGSVPASIPESVFTDQFFGRWLLLIERDLDALLPMEMIRKSTEYVYRNNLIDDPEHDFRGWSNGRLPDGVPCMDHKQYHAKTCWIGAQLNMVSLLGELGDEAASMDVFTSLEHSLHNNHLAVGEWNQSITEDAKSCLLPEEPSKDTPRFPPYPRYKCSWEYLIRILGLKMDEEKMELRPFRSFDFAIHDVMLAGCRLNVTVQKDWDTIIVDGAKSEKAVFDRTGSHKVEFLVSK